MTGEFDRGLMLALAALYEATEHLTKGPLTPSLSVRGLLALLHARAAGPVQPYHAFWRMCIWPGDGDPGDGYIRAAYARTYWSNIVRSLGCEPQAMEFHAQVSGLIARQKRIKHPEERARQAVVEMLGDAKHNREIISTKGHPFTGRGQRLMAERIARGEEPA